MRDQGAKLGEEVWNFIETLSKSFSRLRRFERFERTAIILLIDIFNLEFNNEFIFQSEAIIRHGETVGRGVLPSGRRFISGEECNGGEGTNQGRGRNGNGVKWRGAGDNPASTIRPYNGDNVPHPTHAPFSTVNIPFTDVSHRSLATDYEIIYRMYKFPENFYISLFFTSPPAHNEAIRFRQGNSFLPLPRNSFEPSRAE